jgi:hypothetical protein
VNEVAKYQTTDMLDRPIRDLRVSVTDRCNFRCIYCMLREIFGPGYKFVPRNDLLKLEEIARITRHTVNTTEITSIRYRYPKIPNGSVQHISCLVFRDLIHRQLFSIRSTYPLLSLSTPPPVGEIKTVQKFLPLQGTQATEIKPDLGPR